MTVVTGSALGSETSSVPMRLVGRQPILDVKLRVYGHELLFRSGNTNAFSGDEEHATRSVIDLCLLLAHEQGEEISFINCTRVALMSGIVTLLPPATTVLEILENIDADDEILECCRSLRRKGYRFALDDFTPDRSKLAFLEIAEFIKIDFLSTDAVHRKQIYAIAKGLPITFIAEKIETASDVQSARAEGCTMFQGYFFCKPVIVSTRVIPQNQMVYLRLLAALTQIPANLSEVERLVMSDTSICYRLLRLVNSVLYAPPRPIASIRNAVMMIGDDEFRKMVTVAMASVAASPQSRAAIRVALERAKFCELLAPVLKEPASALYLLGMLSLIDVILQMPMRQTMDLLPLDSKIKAALLQEPSPLCVALDLVRCHELADSQKAEEIQKQIGLSDFTASLFYLESVQWANRVNRISSLSSSDF